MMKLLLPLLGCVALLSGCTLESGYVEARPARVYAPAPYYAGDGYYDGGPGYYGGGTTIVAVQERNRYVNRDRGDRGGNRDRYRASQRGGSYGGNHRGGGSDNRARVSQRGGVNRGGAAQAGKRKPVARERNGKKRDQN